MNNIPKRSLIFAKKYGVDFRDVSTKTGSSAEFNRTVDELNKSDMSIDQLRLMLCNTSADENLDTSVISGL